MKRPIVLLGGVLLMGVLARLQLEAFEPAMASGATGPFGDSAGILWAIVALILAAVAATSVAIASRGRLSRFTGVCLAASVGGIVSARFAPFPGIVIGFVAGALILSVRARSLSIAAAALASGTVVGALALATDRDLSDGPSLGACVLAVLSLVFAATVLFSARARRWSVFRVLHRRGRVTRAAWFASVLVGLWLGLSVETARRVWRLNPGAQLSLRPKFAQLSPRPLGGKWLWPGPLCVYWLSPGPAAAGLTELRAWPELEELNLAGAKIDDQDLANVDDLNGLRILGLADTPVSDAGLFHVRGLTRLQSLDLSGTQVRGVGLRHLAGLTALYSMTFDRTPISDDALLHLQVMKGFCSVSLRDTRVAGPGLRHLQKLPGLFSLALAGCPITDDSLKPLSLCARLDHLDLGRTPITGEGLRHLSGMSWLSKLDMSETMIGDDDLAHLPGLIGLTHLVLQGTRLTDEGLATLAGMKTLLFIDLRKTSVTRAGVERLKKALPGCHVQWDETRSPSLLDPVQ